MNQNYYTEERNVQIVISLLKSHGIRRVVASPGTTNMTFVGSIQQDSWFEIYSSVDERSAAYIACGLAEESGEPVVISCTGATASRNYMPGLTEAYYRKLPVLAITSHRGTASIGHLMDQQIDRRQIPNDIAKISVTIPVVHTSEDEKYCIIEANKAILELTHRGGGPAHINLFTTYSKNFTIKELPTVRSIDRFERFEQFPEINQGDKVAVFISSHKRFNKEETQTIEDFCQKFNAVVICDHTSGYNGKYLINYALIGAQLHEHYSFSQFDKVIHIGEVSGDAYGKRINTKEVWRVSPDGELRDYFGKLTKVFECYEIDFFKYYSSEIKACHTDLYSQINGEYERIYNAIPDLPFGNLWIAKELHKDLPANSVIHFGIFNSLRSWDFFSLCNSINSNCNVGGFGIDGGISTLIGASLFNPSKMYFGVFGDLAFFYDMNVLGNRHIGNNVRILLINNGRGNEFRLSMHPCNIFGDDADVFMAAAGHYGNKSKTLVKNYAENLGFKYLSASNKEEFKSQKVHFLDLTCKNSIVFEVFTEMEDERNALDKMLEVSLSPSAKLRQKVRNAVKDTPLDNLINILKS